MDNAEEYLPYLKSAPHLASISKILSLIPNWSDFQLQYMGNKLSDLLVNKPPKFSTKLMFKSNVLEKVPWCNPDSLIGGVEVTEVLV
jgi:glycerol-3-phosphate dehydrogenase